MNDPNPRSNPDDAERDEQAQQEDATEPDTPEGDTSTQDATLQEIVSEMPKTIAEDDVKHAAVKLTTVFAAVGIGFLFIILAFGASLMRIESGDAAEAAADLDLLIQLTLALMAALLVALLNPVLLAGLIGFETGNRIDEVKPAVTVATVGCALGVIALVLILVVGSAVGFSLLIPDDAADLAGPDEGSSMAGEQATQEESSDGGFPFSGGIVLLVFIGAVGGIAGGGGAYATHKYGGRKLPTV